MKFTQLIAVALVASSTDAYDMYRLRQRGANGQGTDAYDNDPHTASPYDDMEIHKKWDFGVESGKPGSKGPWGNYHGTWVDMSHNNQ